MVKSSSDVAALPKRMTVDQLITGAIRHPIIKRRNLSRYEPLARLDLAPNRPKFKDTVGDLQRLAIIGRNR